MRKIGLTIIMLLMFTSAIGVGAQDDTLNPLSETTNFGFQNLAFPLLIDPYIVTVISGGPVDASEFDLGDDENCVGFVSSAPDFRLNLTGTTSNLRVLFAGVGDATLIVNPPSGEWVCNDDGEGFNPIVDIADPAEGQYDIWVGSLNSGDSIAGYLMVTESQSTPSSIITPTFATASGTMTTPTTALSFDLAPNFGSTALAAGFTPDPHTVLGIQSGGPIDIRALNIGADCRGYATAARDYSIEWTGSTQNLRIFFVADNTTLIVNLPNSQWVCNDDAAGGVNPAINITNPPPGDYDIWVGSLNANESIPGTLYITEGDFTPSNPGA